MTTASEPTEVRLPRQVRERGDRARALLANDPPAPAGEATPAGSEVPAPPPPAPTPTPAPASTAHSDEIPPEIGPEDPRFNDPAYWKHRFLVAEGVWKSHGNRASAKAAAARQEIEAKNGRIADLTRQLEGARTELEEARKGQPDKIDLSEFFTAEEIETLGEEAARIQARATRDSARRIAQEAIDREVKPLKEREAAEREQRSQTAQQRFLAALAEQVPDWEKVNAQDSWLAFLGLDDPATGVWRQAIVDHAQASGNAQPVVNLIEQWRKENAPPPPPPAPPVQPHSTMGTPTETPPGGVPVVKGHPTKAEVRDYYKRRTIGKISPDEVKEFEARLKAAQAAGYYV